MNFLQSKIFWFSLIPSGVVSYWVFWLQIPAMQSGIPVVDGVVKEGWPIPVETSGGCNMIGSCLDFSYTFLSIDLFILAIITTLLAFSVYRATNQHTESQGRGGGNSIISNLLTYFSDWLVLLVLITIAIIFSARGVSGTFRHEIVSLLPIICLLASLIYNFYRFKNKFVVNWGLLRGVIYLVTWPITLQLVSNLSDPSYSILLTSLWTAFFHVIFFYDALFLNSKEKSD